MWRKFVLKAAEWMLPHLSCILLKIAKHIRAKHGVCAICDCNCSAIVESDHVVLWLDNDLYERSVSRETACSDEICD